jgi:hypothetical protein
MILVSQVSFGQQGQPIRVGDAFRGLIKEVRSETVQVRIEQGVLVEGPRRLTQIVTYSADGLRRETVSYNGTIQRGKTIETYLPGGNRESISVYDAEGTLISKIGYEYDSSGNPTVETQYDADGSIKEKKINQWSSSTGGLAAVTKTTGNGARIENSINSNNFGTKNSPKRSVWTTTKPDGSKIENMFEVDSSGTHNDQQRFFAPDGTLLERQVSVVDANVTRLERTEYDGTDNIKNRTLETREYDSHHNLIKITNQRWNSTKKEFEPFTIAYHTIVYAN